MIVVSLEHRKRPSTPYPSVFLRNRAQTHANRHPPQSAQKQRGFVYDRDIVCLPKDYATSDGLIGLPRKKEDRQFLVTNKLIGKIQLRSEMKEKEIFKEIRSVFRTPMGFDDAFEFTILQPTGGDTKALMVPELSDSYKWTAGAVAGKNAKVPIYVLAKDRLEVCVYGIYLGCYAAQKISYSGSYHYSLLMLISLNKMMMMTQILMKKGNFLLILLVQDQSLLTKVKNALIMVTREVLSLDAVADCRYNHTWEGHCEAKKLKTRVTAARTITFVSNQCLHVRSCDPL